MVLLSALAVVAVLWKFNVPPETEERLSSHEGDVVVTSAESIKENDQVPQVPQVSNTHRETPEISDVQGLIISAEAGSSDAAYALFGLTAKCRGFMDSDSTRNLISIELGNGRRADIAERLWATHEYCQDTMANITPDQFDPTRWAETAKTLGHPYFLAQQLTQTAREIGYDKADEQAVEVLKSLEPSALSILTLYLTQRDATFPTALRSELQIPSPETRGAALMMVACSTGWTECEPDSLLMWTACGYENSGCDPHADLISQYYYRFWTPQEPEVLDGYQECSSRILEVRRQKIKRPSA